MPPPLYAPRPLSDPFLSWGPHVRRWAARRIGLKLLTWQAWVVDRMLEVDPATGRLRYREILLSVARRNGKTSILRALVGWVTEESPIWMRSLNGSYTKDQALITFNAASVDLTPLGCEANAAGTRIGIGYIGSPRRHIYVSGRAAGWRGLGQDLVMLDEVQEQRDEEAWAAAEPMIRTSRNGLLLAIGTASVSDHAVLAKRLYDRGILAIGQPDSDPRYAAFIWEGVTDDDDGIRAANPATADDLLTMDVLRATRRSQTPARFVSETLNRWIVDPLMAWSPPGAWDACADRGSVAPITRPTFAVDVSPSWQRGSIAVAAHDDDAERIHIEVAKDWPETGRPVDEGAVILEVRRLTRQYPRSVIGYDPQSAIAAAMKRLADEDLPVVAVGGTEFRAACAGFLGHVVTGRIRHRSDAVLDSAVRLAARSEDAEAWRFVRRRSAGHIDALVAATIAVHLSEQPPPPRPAIY